MFKDFRDYANDPIEALFVRLAEDPSPDKIDLGIGVFRDDAGKVPVMQAVRKAEQQLVARDLPKSYMSPLGNPDYCRDLEKLALGADHPVLAEGRIISAQTEPVWTHQLEFFEKAGMQIRSYRYYDQINAALDFAGMQEDLRAMKPDDLLLLHGCCHNPTGQDLDLAQWQVVADLVNETGAVPFIDVAYQGFGEGIDEDVAGLRLMAASASQMLLTVSSSKSFGIYRERAGLLSIIVSSDAQSIESVRRKLRDTVRQLYFMAPDHGAAIVHEILSTPELESLWRAELNKIREHVVNMRKALRTTIEDTNPGFDAAFIENQHGMFSCLPVSEAEQLLIEQQFHIYMLPNARVNVAAMNAEQSAILAEAFAFVRAERASAARQASA